MRVAIIASLLIAGCAQMPESYCKAGYAFTYSQNGGWRQVWSEHGKGVPCND